MIRSNFIILYVDTHFLSSYIENVLSTENIFCSYIKNLVSMTAKIHFWILDFIPSALMPVFMQVPLLFCCHGSVV